MELRESAVLDLRINGKTVVNDLDEISGKISDLRTAQKGMLDDIGNAAKGTAAYKDLAKEIKSLEVDFKQVRTEMGLQGMTMKQLDAYTKDLNKELKDLVPGTTAYVNKAKEIGEVNTHVRAVRESTAELTGSVKQSESTWSQLKLWIMGAFSATVIFEAARAIFDFFRDSVKEARAFETAAQSLSAVTGATGKDLEFYKQQAMEVGPAMGKSAAEMLKAYELIGSAKPELLSNKEALAALTQEAILLSQAARIDLTEASEVLAGSLNQFGEAADQSNRFVNVLAAGVTYGSASIKEMGSSLKAAGTVASAAGLSFEETNAAIQSLATITLKGEQSGTMFRNMLLTLQAGADDTNPKVVGLEKAIENLGKKNLSAAELTKMFGKENFVAAQYLITHGAQVSDLTKKLTGTSEATLQAGKNTDTLDFKIQKATATFKNISLEMGSKLAPAVGKVIDFFIDLVENSDPLIIAFETVYEVFGTVFELLGDAVRVLFPNFTTGGNTMQKVLQALGTIVVSIVAPIKIFAGVLMDVIKLMTILQDGAAGVGKILTGDFAGAAESFSKAKTAIGEFGNATKTAFTSVGDAYKKIWTDAPGHVKDGTDKSTAVQTNANKNDVANHAKAMDERTAKSAAAAEKQRQKAEEEAKKESEARTKAAAEASDRIDKLNIELIEDEKQRKTQLLQWEFKEHVEKINREKIDEKTKNAEIELLRRQLTQNITQLETDYRAKYLAEEEKKRKENEARERETRELRAKAEFETSKAIIEREMADKSISIEARKKLTLALLELEQREELRKIAEVAAREREQAQGNADAIVAIDNNEKAQRDAVHLQFLAKQRDAQAAALAEKQAQWQQFLGVLSGLLQGDMTNFLAYLKQKTDANMANISQEKQSQLSKFTEIAGYAQAALNTMSELSKMYHEKQLQKMEAEKQAQVDKWKELYDNGKITKEEYNEAIKKLDDEYAEKKRIEMHKEWQRQKIMALTQTAIQGALAIVSAFTLGPIAGAIAAVAVGITIAKQVKEINAQEPPKFAKGGIPRGPGHDQGGIKLVNSRTGQIEGEMEGGEPYMILSRNTYRNNKGVIDRLLHSSLHRNGEPIYAKGGLFGSLDENGRIIRKYKDGGMVQPIDEDYGGDIGGGGGGGFDDPGFQAPAITDPAPYFDQLSKQADDSFDLTIMKFDLLASRMADMIEINKTMIALQQQTNAKLSDVSSNIQQIANRPIVVSVPLQKIDEAQSNQQAVNESSTLSPG